MKYRIPTIGGGIGQGCYDHAIRQQISSGGGNEAITLIVWMWTGVVRQPPSPMDMPACELPIEMGNMLISPSQVAPCQQSGIGATGRSREV